MKVSDKVIKTGHVCHSVIPMGSQGVVTNTSKPAGHVDAEHLVKVDFGSIGEFWSDRRALEVLK